MIIRMTDTKRAVSDGHSQLRQYFKGETYIVGKDIGDTEARRLISGGHATALETKTRDEVTAEIIAENRAGRAAV